MASSPTTSSPPTSITAPAAPSTSIPAASSTELASAIKVRRRTAPLTAIRLRGPYTFTDASGIKHDLHVGDWLIRRGEHAVDFAPPPLLDEKYEVLHEGEVTLPAAVCQRLERTLGIGATRDAIVLQDAVERIASISIGTIHVDFTPGQMEEIAWRAKKRGRSVEAELRAVVDRIKDELFHRG